MFVYDQYDYLNLIVADYKEICNFYNLYNPYNAFYYDKKNYLNGCYNDYYNAYYNYYGLYIFYF